MCVVITAGGTGGHLFPAQNTARELKEHIKGLEVVFMAKGLNTNSRFRREEFRYYDIPSGPITPKKLLFSTASILYGVIKSIKLLRKLKPAVVVGFGSYHSFPVLVAAKLLGIDIILHEANSIPGKVNKLFSPYAVWTGVFFPDAALHLKGKVVQTDIPLRKERSTRKEALAHYGLPEDCFTILVFGGSLGASRLNELAHDAITRLQKRVQVLHFTGSSEERLTYESRVRAHVAPFEHNMHYAWAAADLAITRAGASTVAESIAFGVPSIFIPYPQSADGHQDKNAAFVVEQIGGAVAFQEKGLSCKMIADAIEKMDLIQMKKALTAACMQKIHFTDLVAHYVKGKK